MKTGSQQIKYLFFSWTINSLQIIIITINTYNCYEVLVIFTYL